MLLADCVHYWLLLVEELLSMKLAYSDMVVVQRRMQSLIRMHVCTSRLCALLAVAGRTDAVQWAWYIPAMPADFFRLHNYL